MARLLPNVLTIAPGQDFTAEVVTALLDGRLIGKALGDDPLSLADVTLYVPTQRARGLLEHAFAAAFAPRPIILPRIRPLGEPQDVLDAANDGFEQGLAEGAAPLIPDMARRFLLLPAIRAWRIKLIQESGLNAPDFAELYALSTALGRLIDEARIDGVPLERLETITPEDFEPARFDEYWIHTRDFLALAAQEWPKILAAQGALDAMQARLAGIEAEAMRLKKLDPKNPVLVIGSTGSVLATARLMRAVAQLDFGAVILPGLDLALDDESWALIGAKDTKKVGLATRFAHPQASLKRSLTTIGIERGDVKPLGTPTPRIMVRNAILSQSLRPAETSLHWHVERRQIPVEEGLNGLSIVLASDEREEAEVIALLMRETLETPGADVALVTADRALAAYVQVSLSRWGVVAQDSAGEPLGTSAAGSLLRLMLEAAENYDGASLLALLRHPLIRLDETAETHFALVDALEIAVLRGRRFTPATSLAMRVRDALENPPAYPHPALKRLAQEDIARLPALAKAVDDCLAPFTAHSSSQAQEGSLADYAHSAWEALLRLTREVDGTSSLTSDSSALTLHTLLIEVASYAGSVTLRKGTLSAALTPMLMERNTPLSSQKGHPRALILGPLESRLIMPTRLIIGGLNEGSFPPSAVGDPFLNRAMRDELGLQAPERRIGQSAHDFAMLAAHHDVFLTRAQRVGGQPSLPSRFLRRLEAFIGHESWKKRVQEGQIWCNLAQTLDKPDAFSPVAQPSPIPTHPAPPLPARLNITEIGTLRRDPYTLYARHILGLKPLERIDPPLGARERGTLLHDILYAWCNTPEAGEPLRAAQSLRDIGAEKFRPFRHEVEFYRFYWQQFEALIPHFIAFQTQRLAVAAHLYYEVRGKAMIAVPSYGDLPLTGKADRLEIGADGGLTIIDYKSGAAPSVKQVIAGFEPQLTITAALARRGGFPDIPRGIDVSSLAYMPLMGEKAAKLKSVTLKDSSLSAFAEADWLRLTSELAELAAGKRGYTAQLRPFKSGTNGDYDHLARVKEWRLTRADEAEDGESEELGQEAHDG